MDPNNYKTLPVPPVPSGPATLGSATFRIPPLDGSLTIPEICDWHLKNSPNHPLFQFANDNQTVTSVTWAEVAKAIHVACHLLTSDMPSRKNPGQVVAILASADFITFFTVYMGILRLGYAAFFISPRNSATAVAHLLAQTGACHLVVGPEQALQQLASTALKAMEEKHDSPPPSSSMPLFEDLYMTTLDPHFEMFPPIRFGMDDPCVIVHTSGSTALPKPIWITHYRFFLWGFAPFFGPMNKAGLKLSLHSIPMFHGMGVIQSAWAVLCGLTITHFKPRSPSTPITAESVLKDAVTTRSDIVFAVSSFVEEWSRDPNDIQELKHFDRVIFSGGPLAKAAGDHLVSQDVPLCNVYGCCECGCMSEIYPETPGKDWEYIKFNPLVNAHMVPDESSTYSQLYMVTNPHQVPNVMNAAINGKPAYSTSDWFSPHPSKPGLWRIVDRVDNQIIHSTGEKTNPGPLESILNMDPHIKTAVMFGRGKFNAGVLIEPRPSFAFDPSAEEKLVSFRNAVWPSIEKLNKFAPQHSRIFKEMILISSPFKPFEYTAKFTPRRAAIIAAYASEIEILYATVDQSTQADLSPPSSWTVQETTDFVRTVINKVLKQSVTDSDDIFGHGCDSLQATWIRNTLIHALKQTSVIDVRKLSSNFVYQHPTISSLAAHITSFGRPSLASTPTVKDKVSAMLSMVTKYSSSFPKRSPSTVSPPGDTVLLTGSTGGLGASVLAKLAQSPEIRRIYALNRSGITPVVDRQTMVLQGRGYDPKILDSPRIVLLEGDLAEENLGLSAEMLAEIRASVTHIIHTAYRVNWNISLSSFESHVKTVRNLVDLALSSPFRSPPRLVFVSSVAVLCSLDGNQPAKEEPVAPEVAVDSGYSESKWVCERLLEVSAAETELRPIVVRAGQITSSPSGVWGIGEWVPSLIRSSIYLKALPSVKEDISWIPADAAAQVLINMRNSDEPILHLAHPRPVSASVILSAFSDALQLPLVPMSDWVALLEKSADAFGPGSEEEVSRMNPALRLIDFFRNARTPKSAEAFGAPSMDTSKAQSMTESLQNGGLSSLGSEDVSSWLSYWQSIGFIPATNHDTSS